VADRARGLESIRTLQRLLDEAFRIPGTNIRFGWDAIAGLIPWVGDVGTAVLAATILFQAHRMRVPRIVQLRMLLNVGFDLLVGLVPIFGDVADVFWKANSRNLELLDRHWHAPATPTAGDWVFVIGVLAALGALASLPIILLVWLGTAVGRGLI
jgi:hypothetical protein